MRTRLLGEYWHECARCGNDRPESMLTKSRAGLWLCSECYDDNEDEDDS